MSRDASFSAFRGLKVRSSGQHVEQYLLADRASRRKLHPHHSQYLASKIFAPTGTLWLSYSRSPCQRAMGSLRLGVALWGRGLIGSSTIKSIFILGSPRATKCMTSYSTIVQFRRSRLVRQRRR